ncbi:MAG: beta-lactamase family protein [Williamsia sp.]|nr:beta-lactamase family protein [Williamsia sp.]
MKKILTAMALTGLLGAISCSKNDRFPDADKGGTNVNHPLKKGLQTIIDKYTGLGVPALQVVVKNKDGLLIAQGGYVDKDTQMPINGNGTTWIFSITKTYTAALIMKLKERGQVDLNKPIKQYLPENVGTKLKNSGKITVRNLLNHSSGIVNFIELDEYRARQFSDPSHQPTVTEILDMVYNENSEFEPGSTTHYSNTNYLLLGIILEKLTGKSYESLLRTEIIEPLKLEHTYFNLNAAQITALKFPEYYFDPTGNGQLTKGTSWNHALGNASLSWGGIAAWPTDVISFYEALTKGKLIKPVSLSEMQQYQNDQGLGIESYQYLPGSTLQFGHEGDGVGNSTMILYVPDSKALIFINCTVGRQLPGPFLNKIIDLKNELCTYVARGS